MMSILTLGVLNRVMIQEIAIPATLVSLVLALPTFVSPSRIWFGQMFDKTRKTPKKELGLAEKVLSLGEAIGNGQ